MFTTATPESVGIASSDILEFYKTLEDYKLSTHSVIMAKGDKIISECYYAPFNENFKHRMYSVSKSFVSVAIGLLIEDGKLSLDDKFLDFFPEYAGDGYKNSEKYKELTIREMLTMETCKIDGVNWFTSGTDDRVEVYFRNTPERYSGTNFRYDSPGSYMLCAIAEKLSGMPFMEFLKQRFLLKTGFSADAYCIKAPGKYSFGDSGVMCTAKDLLRFARFVMNGGTWDGVRYMNEDYLREATSKLVDNNQDGIVNYGTYGYGYQIWQAPEGGFAFIGMGDEFAICDRKRDFIFIMNADNQGNPISRNVLYHGLYNGILRKMSNKPIPENEKAYAALCDFTSSDNRKLACIWGDSDSPFAEKLSGVTYELEPNPMKIEYFRFDFERNLNKGKLTYKNAQGEKTLVFGLGHNEFGKFPEEDYADLTATVGVPGHKYDCATSAAWVEEKKIHLKVQIIDKYFGNCNMSFGFKDDKVGIQMVKTAEAFLNEYTGFANGRIKM